MAPALKPGSPPPPSPRGRQSPAAAGAVSGQLCPERGQRIAGDGGGSYLETATPNGETFRGRILWQGGGGDWKLAQSSSVWVKSNLTHNRPRMRPQ